jgi:hypothetical protein
MGSQQVANCAKPLGLRVHLIFWKLFDLSCVESIIKTDIAQPKHARLNSVDKGHQQ